MKNIFRIDLNKPLEALKRDCDALNLRFDTMVKNKKDFDAIFFIKDDNRYKMIAFINKGSNEVTFYEDFSNLLYSMVDNVNSIYEPVVESVKNEPVVLSIDTILDKISEKGIDSLSKEERDFLDKQ